jgi:hypothetical protein
MLANTIIRTQRTKLLNRQTRTFVDSLVNKPSKINELRNVQNLGGTWQGAKNPTYLKQSGDTTYFFVGIGLCTLALGRLSYGYYSMAYGINKIE